MSDAEVLRKAQEGIDRKRAALGIAPDTIARPGAEETPQREFGTRPARTSDLPPNDTHAFGVDKTDAYAAPIPEGLYSVAYDRVERGRAFRREVDFAFFTVVHGEHAGRSLLRFYNVQKGSRLARSSSLYGDFVAVVGRRPPSTTFKLSWAFSGAVVRARVVTVKDRPGPGGKRVPMPDFEHYSKIDALTGFESGSTPATRGSFEGVARPKKKRRRPMPREQVDAPANEKRAEGVGVEVSESEEENSDSHNNTNTHSNTHRVGI